ncbi:MAG: PQQ-like beta-propeller repeat protein [Phycisphaerae bacterium]|nr:PQQ-like beta-propeller repeat protein [Phycisphaerae bacterium]
MKNRTTRMLLCVLIGVKLLSGITTGEPTGPSKKPKPSSDWPQWRGGPFKTGVCENSPKLAARFPGEKLKKMWAKKVPSAYGYSSLVVAEDRVIFSGFRYKHLKNKWILTSGLGHISAYKPSSLYAMTGEIARARVKNAKLASLNDSQKERLADLICIPFASREKLLGKIKSIGLDARQVSLLEPFIKKSDKLRLAESTVWCLDAKTGRILWHTPLGIEHHKSGNANWFTLGTPAIANGRAYIYGPRMYCLNLRDGKIVWKSRHQISHHYYYFSSPLLVDGVVVGYYSAWDAATGRLLWSHPEQMDYYCGLEGWECASPTAWRSGSKTYALLTNTKAKVLCVELNSGKFVWQGKRHLFTRYRTPAVRGNLVVNIDGKGLYCATLTTSDPKTLWRAQEIKAPYDQGRSVAVSKNYVFAMGSKALACYDLRSGKRIWMQKRRGRGGDYSSLLVADGKLFFFAYSDDVGSKTGSGGKRTLSLHVVDVRNGKYQPLAVLPIPMLHRLYMTPTIAHGRLFIRAREDNTHKVISYDLRAKSGN